MMFWTIIVLILFGLSSLEAKTNPLRDPNVCGRPTCDRGQFPKYNYHPNLRQTYSYSVDIATSFEGTSSNVSRLHVDTRVHFDWLSHCEGILRFSEVKLKEKQDYYDRIEDIDYESPPHEKSEEFQRAVEEYLLRFSFEDGIISELCPDELELTWVLNLKRGLLSMMNNNMERLDVNHKVIESDVHGTCPTKYTFQGAHGTSLVIEKTKDFEKCTNRNKLVSVVQTEHYDFRTNHQTLPMVKSSLQCDMSVDHNVYNRIECRETHMFQPFSNNRSGAVTTTRQKLVLLTEEEQSADEPSFINKRTNLIYDHDTTLKPTTGELKMARSLIKELCDITREDMHQEFSGVFWKYIHSARKISYTALNQLYIKTGSVCHTGRKHFLNALPFLGSGAAVELMKNLIIQQEIPKDTANEWFLAIALIPRPEEGMLESVIELLKNYPDDATVSLSVSSMVHSFCRNKLECLFSGPFVEEIMSIFQTRIEEAYESRNNDRASKEKILVSLKSLANIGIQTDDLNALLFSMIEDENLGVEVRIAAVNCFRRFPCEESSERFIDILRNQTVDSEVRIASYLQTMRCPTYQIIEVVRDCLQNEEVNQVGSFIWSHLKNLIKSSMPDKIEVQALLYDKELNEKFSIDVRKFSSSYEGSFFFNEYNAGASYESNVIFSTSSYVPRSAMVNLTIDLFGESINLFELSGRVEGFENFLELLFGPKGPFTSIKEKVSSKLRFPRSTKNENDVLKSEIDQLPNIFEGKFGEPQVSLGMKIFGNELKFLTYNGGKEIGDALSKFNPIDHLKTILSGREISYNRAAMFLDSSWIIPTGTGFPLTMNAVGTSAINFKLYGSLKGANFTKDHELDLVTNFRPSVTLNIEGTMSVDAYYGSTGIKLKTNAYTSSVVEGHLKIRGAQLVTLKLNLPNEKTQIFSANSELIVINNNEEEVQTGIKQRVENTICSWPKLYQTIGIQLCTNYQFPNTTNIEKSPKSLLAGPMSFSLSIPKSDPSAKTYLIEYNLGQKINTTQVVFKFTTPGSKLNKHLIANLTLDNYNQNLTLIMRSHNGLTTARGRYRYTENEKFVYLDLENNGRKNFDFGMSLTKKDIKNGKMFIPRLYIAAHNERIADLSGTLKYVMKILHGILQWDVDLNFKTKNMTTSLSGYITKAPMAFTTKLNLNYQLTDYKKETVALEFKMSDKSSNQVKTYMMDYRLESSEFPKFNFEASSKIQTATGHIDCKLDLNYGLNWQDPKHTLTLQYSFLNTNRPDGKKLSAYLELRQPSSLLDQKLQFTYELSGPAVSTQLMYRYDQEKIWVIDLYMYTPRSSLVFMESKFNVTVPGLYPMLLEWKIHEKISREYDVDIKGQWFNGYNISTQGKYQDRSSTVAASHYLKLIVQSNKFDNIDVSLVYFQDRTDFKLEVKAYQNNEEYYLQAKHSLNGTHSLSSFAELRYQGKVYSFTSFITLKDQQQLILEIHFDKWRDINFKIRGLNQNTKKELEIEMKWDANRDPDQKLMLALEYEIPSSQTYKGQLDLSYPRRKLTTMFNLQPKNNHYTTYTKLNWDLDEFLQITTSADSKYGNETLVVWKGEVLSSFENWEKTLIFNKLQVKSNMIFSNFSIIWENDKYITLALYENHNIEYEKAEIIFYNSLLSTIKDIPSIECSLKHKHNTTKADTNLIINYDRKKKFDLKSFWEILQNEHSKYFSGQVSIINPFHGYSNIDFTTKYYNTKDTVKGILSLDLDLKKYVASMKGHWRKVTENMFVLNVTLPQNEYGLRLGFSEEERHLVAQIKSPGNGIGVELLCFVNNFTDFNIKMNLATPFEVLEDVLIVAKLKQDRVDFRFGWNYLLFGFAGVWHYNSLLDFEYSYRIYTPVKGYEENYIVLKLILGERFDTEFSVKLTNIKIGVMMEYKIKPNILKELGFEKDDKEITIKSIRDTIESGDPDMLKGIYAITGSIQLDTYFYKSIKGNFDIETKPGFSGLLLSLKLPNGFVEIMNECHIVDYSGPLSITNELKVSSSYESFKEITQSTKIGIGRIPNFVQYDVAIDLNILRNRIWKQMGLETHYSQISSKELNASTYNGSLTIFTPFEALPYMNTLASFEIENEENKANFIFEFVNTTIKAYLASKVDEEHLDTTLQCQIKSPILTLPLTKLRLQKNSTADEDSVDFNLEVLKSNLKPKYFVKSFWRVKSLKEFSAGLKTVLPLQPLENVDCKVEVNGVGEVKIVDVQLIVLTNSIYGNASLKANILHVDVLADLLTEEYPINFSGVLTDKNENQQHLIGLLTCRNATYNASGDIDLYNDWPKAMKLELTPQFEAENIIVQYDVGIQDNKYELTSKYTKGSFLSTMDGFLIINHKYDWILYLKLDTPIEDYKTFVIDTKFLTPNVNNVTFEYQSTTPFSGLEVTRFGYTNLRKGYIGSFLAYHFLANAKGNIQFTYRWFMLEDMALKIIGHQQLDDQAKDVALTLFYNNEEQSFKQAKFGGDLNVDKDIWIFGTNMSVGLLLPELGVEANLRLPSPKPEVHTVRCLYNVLKSNELQKEVDYQAKYFTATGTNNYGATGYVKYSNNTNISGNLKLMWGLSENEYINNILELSRGKEDFDLFYGLRSPYYINKDTFQAKVTSLSDTPYQNLTLSVFCPEASKIGNLVLNFQNLTDFSGNVNVTIPSNKLKWLGGNFNFENRGHTNKRRVEVIWPNNTALVDSEISYKIQEYANFETGSGNILVEVPIKTRHTAKINYEYTQKPQNTKGTATVAYNNNKIMDGKYNCDSLATAGMEKEITTIELENKWKPLGLNYERTFTYSAPGDGTNLPTKDIRQVELYHLKNPGIRIAGDMEIHSNISGDKIILKARQANRVISLNYDYDIKDQIFTQTSSLKLTPNLYFDTTLKLTNNTQDEILETQKIDIQFFTPMRHFTVLASYNATNVSLYSDLGLFWNSEEKNNQENTLQSSFNWEQKNEAPLVHEVELKFLHPTFERNASLKGFVQLEDKDKEFGFEIEYCNEEEQKFDFVSTFTDNSEAEKKNYVYNIVGKHPETQLDLAVVGTISLDQLRHILLAQHDARYKRSFYGMEYGVVEATIDVENKMIEFKKETRSKTTYFSAMYDAVFPVFKANVTREDGEDVKEAGDFYMDVKEKIIRAEYNMTEDGSQSFHLTGAIPDARSAHISVWRDYDDIRLTDMSYFLKLNHSRLVISSLKWRPQLKKEMNDNIKLGVKDFYKDASTSFVYWKNYIRNEILEEMVNVWDRATPYIEGYLDDVKDLNVLKEDVAMFENYLNESYYENAFYFRDICDFSRKAFEQMTNKTRNETLPVIVNEILDLMGDSTKNIWKNIEIIIEKIKSSYENSQSLITRLINSNPMEMFKVSVERLFIKWDQISEEMFLNTFVYLDKISDRIFAMFIKQREDLWKIAEPVIFEVAKYVNSMVYHTINDFLGYLSARANEIINTPYFIQVTKSLQYFDEFYKDITTNDTLTIMYKYTKIISKYLNEKFFPKFDLEKEVNNINNEISNALSELKKNPTVDYYLLKFTEFLESVKWMYDYIDGARGIREFFKFLHQKWMDVTLTALDAENKYRVAKTYFKYDIKAGIIHLEQKLPMSWHAFNETPKFQEIPEIRAIGDIQDYFTTSNKTLWTIYNDYKPYMETKDWLPPFNVRGLLIGSHHFVTFDRKYYDFHGSCSYLLAHDFLDRNFSLAVSYDGKGKTHKLHLFIKDLAVVTVDVFANSISIGNSSKIRLPLTIGDTYIYQEAEILIINSKSGYGLTCNMEFEVCMLDLSGWYFGKTAGLLGTLNNEPSDDFLTPSKNIVTPTTTFAQSWAFPPTCPTPTPTPIKVTRHMELFCDSLFSNKMSPLHSCFQRVNPGPFKDMCLNSEGEKEACSVAVGYMEACRVENTPLRIPDVCVKCKLLSGIEVTEGTFVELNSTDIPKSTDVVFIVEAKDCNDNIRANRSIDALVSILHKELEKAAIKDNRYSLIVFGGNGIYEDPRSIVVNNEIFANHQTIPSYFENIPIGANGSSDIFEALNFATKLVFRPGVSKTFILLPCSDCSSSKMKELDYAALHQLLREYDITLHILMNGEFQFQKGTSRISKQFFGMDHELAYTKKDAKTLKGDEDLRRQTRVDKSTLGLCVPLALETNGTVFSGNKLEGSKRTAVKTFAAVFGKRVALTAMPSSCQTCECNAYDHGQSYMECFPCFYPSTSLMEDDFDDEEPMIIDEEEIMNSEEHDDISEEVIYDR